MRLFAAATITYNVAEAVVALWAGNVAGSSALIGFQTDAAVLLPLSSPAGWLVLNSTLGWWWADAVAALVMAAMAAREGVNAWKGDVCCTVPHGASENAVEAAVRTLGEAEADGDTEDDGGCCEGCTASAGPTVVRVVLGERDG